MSFQMSVYFRLIFNVPITGFQSVKPRFIPTVMASFLGKLIQENDHVLLKKEDSSRLLKVQKNKDVWLGKVKFTLDGIIGHPYGSMFEVKDRKMVKIDKRKLEDVEDANKGKEEDKDNRNLHDLDSNQKLTSDEIIKMKEEGVTGNELIGQLIENSATFQTKTEYSKEKYVKKKKKKHLMEFTILKPNSRLMCNIYFAKEPHRVCNLRADSLAQILTWGNVHANSTVAVFDTCLGIVTGAVLERLGGFGKVISFYYGDTPMKSQLEAYDFPKEVRDTLYHFPLDLVYSLKQGHKVSECVNSETNMEMETDASTVNSKSDCNEVKTESITEDKDSKCSNLEKNDESLERSKTADTVETETKSENSKDDNEQNGESTKIEEGGFKNQGNQKRKSRHNKRPNFEDRVAARAARAKDIEAARNVILEKNIDCLIIASKFHPTPIVTSLLDYVAPSRQIVVFCQFKEALQDCYVQMRDHGGLVSFRLSETWLRNYQVLQDRTHPVIQMSGTGGYLLTATTVINNTENR